MNTITAIILCTSPENSDAMIEVAPGCSFAAGVFIDIFLGYGKIKL